MRTVVVAYFRERPAAEKGAWCANDPTYPRIYRSLRPDPVGAGEVRDHFSDAHLPAPAVPPRAYSLTRRALARRCYCWTLCPWVRHYRPSDRRLPGRSGQAVADV